MGLMRRLLVRGADTGRHGARAARRSVRAAIAVVVAIAGTGAVADHPPNLVFVVADDQGVDAIEGPTFPNDLQVHTPTLATLAGQGRIFSQARVNPVCSSTRAGFLTGRFAQHNGIAGVMAGEPGHPDYLRLSLQTEEHTLAELLQSRGYYTIFIDKWHLGEDLDRGHHPSAQGFDRVELTEEWIALDDPLEVGDEHLSRMVNLSIDAVRHGPAPGQPWALFFHSIDPHIRHDESGREPAKWWRVDEALLPSGEPYYAPDRDTDLDRYRAVIEAMDTEIARLLIETEVVDETLTYRPQSNTIVTYFADNGSPDPVTSAPLRSKSTLFEGGVRVPFFMFGAGVPTDGMAVARQIMHIDVYDTIADILRIPPRERGRRPRDGMSFADAIGWSGQPLPQRAESFTSKSRWLPDNHFGAITDGRYKVVTRIGGSHPADYFSGYFFDLLVDPTEDNNLLEGELTPAERVEFIRLRERMADLCYTAVPGPIEHAVIVPQAHIRMMASDGSTASGSLPLGHHYPDTLDAVEHRILIRFDMEALAASLPPGRTIADLDSAQLMLRFDEDVLDVSGVDTDVIRVFPMSIDWYNREISWADIVNAHQSRRELGAVDLPPNIIPRPTNNMQGHPLPPGARITFGREPELLRLVQFWAANPKTNHGLVLIATPDRDLGGDQRVRFLPEAELRVTVPTP